MTGFREVIPQRMPVPPTEGALRAAQSLSFLNDLITCVTMKTSTGVPWQVQMGALGEEEAWPKMFHRVFPYHKKLKY